MGQLRGFGIMNGAPVPQERTGNEPARIARALEAIEERAVLRPISRPIPLNMTSGEFKKIDGNRDTINALLITVTSGTLDLFFGLQDTPSQCVMRFTAGDTRQITLPPQEYDFTIYANGAALLGCIVLQAL